MTRSNVLFALLFGFLLTGCSKDDDKDSSSGGGAPTQQSSATIKLTGDDTKFVGNEILTGQIQYGRKDLTGIEQSIIIVDKNSSINASGPAPADTGNFVTIVVAEASISMTIMKNSTKWDYLCNSTFSTFQNCGGLTFDVKNQKVLFEDATVENTDNHTVLTLNGELEW